MADKPDEREAWTRDCLAKAAYCEFALGIVVDGGTANGYRRWRPSGNAQLRKAPQKRRALGRHKPANGFFNRLTHFAVVSRTAGFAARPAR